MASDSGGAESVFPISPLLIIPSTTGQFTVYLRQDNRLVLYANKGDQFTREHRERLTETGVHRVFVSSSERGDYHNYLRENLGLLLEDETIPIEERSQAWYEASVSLVKNVFDQKLPRPLTKAKFGKVKDLVGSSIRFLTDAKALAQVARLISKGFKIYDHSVGVLVLSACLIQSYDQADETLLVNCGMGALLHDMGRARLPEDIQNKREENLSAGERELLHSHPAMGVAMCANLSLPQETLNCILFHHELENGLGYPSGMRSEEIPYYVKAVSLCNAYDDLTRVKPWRTAKKPYEALRHIKSCKDCYNLDAFRRLILVLSNAQIDVEKR